MKRENHRNDNVEIILEIDILDFVNNIITNNKRKVF